MGYSILAGAALKSTIVLAVAWLCALLLRKHSAAFRHIVWTAALAGVIALPLLSVSLPALRVPVSAGFLPERIGVLFQATALDLANSAAISPSRRGPSALPHLHWLAFFWMAGTSLAFVYMFLAYGAIRWRSRSARPFGDRELSVAVARSLRLRKPAEILQTDAGSMPMTFGILRPVIFMPSDAAQWSEDRRRLVLLHEMAHVRRHDPATQLLARMALSLYWWNPLAWIAWRQFLKERERATDDLVLNSGARASDYARHLLEIARAMRPLSIASSAAVLVSHSRSRLEDRLCAILDSSVNRATPPRPAVVICAFAVISAVVPLAALHAQEARQPSRLTPKFISLGAAALLKHDYSSAIHSFEQARDSDPTHASLAVMWMAVASERQNHSAEAEALFRSALESEDERSQDAILTMRLYARFLRDQKRYTKAADLENRIVRIQTSTTIPQTPGIYRISGNISPPKVLRKVEPEYSDEARAAKLAGTVVIYVEIGPDGRAHNTRVIRTLGLGLDEQAMEAILQWHFQPGLKDGRPVTVMATIEVNFRLA